MKPAFGECSLKETDRRRSVLDGFLRAVRDGGSARLREPVRVTQDFCGMETVFTVRFVRPFPGVLPESLQFSLGKDGYGEDVSTDEISTDDLVRIEKQLC